MSSTTILQLRQQESSAVTQNGVFEVTLDHPIELDEGDVVQVKAVYLDTVADVIELTEDEEITMTAMIYVQNYNLDQTYPFSESGGTAPLRIYQDDATIRTPFEKGDNHLWFLSTAHTNDVDTNWSLPFVEIIPINTTSDSKRFGDITLEFQCTPITPGAVPIIVTSHITSKVDRRWNDPKNNPRDLGITCTGTTAGPTIKLLTSKADLTNAGILEVNFSKYQTPIPNGEVQIEPQFFPIGFRIPRGTYTPTEISQVITNAVNNLQYDGKVSTTYGVDTDATYPNPPTQTNWPSMNPFLQTVLKNVKDLSDLGGAAQIFVNADSNYGGTKGGGAIYFNYDLTKMVDEYKQEEVGPPPVAYQPPLDKFLGTNQFAMEFDEQENKIKMTQMHFPLFVNDTTGATIVENGLQGIAFNEPQRGIPGGDNDMFEPAGGIASAYSGICFSSLSPGWFWDAMGFSNSQVSPVKNVKMNYPNFTSAAPTTSNSYTLDINVGENTTSAYEGLDLPVIHSNAYPFAGGAATQFGRYSVPRQDAKDGNDVFVSTADVESIFSNKTLNDNIADEGYFLVEVSSNFKQNLIGGRLGDAGGLKTSRDTQSIVNRYYTSGSFTSDQGAGSIVYEHIGEPQMLSNFGIKVRNPNGTFVADSVLKEKNAIFIEIVKQNKTSNNKQN